MKNPYNVPNTGVNEHLLNASALLTVNHTGNLNRLASGGNIPITELKADTIFENLGDILALGFIKSNQYFQLKSMLNSSDRESQELARKIITTHFQKI